MSELQSQIRLVSINCEDLFLFIDQPSLFDLDSLSEAEWQKLSNSTQENKALSKCRALARALTDLDADVIACSEVGGIESLQNFSKLFLDDQYRALLIEGNSDRGIDIGYLVKRTLTFGCDLRTHRNRPIGYLYPHEQQSKETDMPEGSEAKLVSHRFSRDVAELRLIHPSDQRTLAVILTVHLKSARDPFGVDPFGRERRGAEFKTLLEIYSETLAELGPQVPIVLCGDFNGTVVGPTADPEFASIQSTDLVSVIERAHQNDQSTAARWTWIGFNRYRPVNRKEIDFILISEKHIPRCALDQTKIHRYTNHLGQTLSEPTTWDERNQFPSDHFPLVTELRLID